ncbi:nucleotide pyrophosphohydrolase [Halopseudomonas aestusnigri]|uniref:nucleotide pyrophosphohydrolase n=1 Tax=Halopseudomonas aestusnigri TaxID=857252 RepID=UPI0025549B54|nr:nucleotide pyrophosphohydrolase [Halopseudomonas aestusnigri]MDL2199384.1 nucleotide pyrophosphohydrolase [Halopseudomonas aestusnigri]
MEEQKSDVLKRLQGQIREFVAERDWEPFHTPKNLAISLSVEAAELLEPFQWLATGGSEELGEEKMRHVRDEMADVFIYLLRMADKLDVDLVDAVHHKLALNRQKYPAEVVKGSAKKYSDY